MDQLTLIEAAEIAGLKYTATLRQAIARKDLPATKQGRDWFVMRHDLQQWIDNPAMHKRGAKSKKSARE